MKIVKTTDRKFGTITGYIGTCDNCRAHLEYEEELVVIEVDKNDECVLVCPKDTIVCPNCNGVLNTLRIYYAPMNVSEEFESLRVNKK